MSTRRTSRGGWEDPKNLPKGPNGRPLCRQCGQEIPKGRRRTFCSEACVDQWRVRTDPGYARYRVFERDHGICARCGVDTVEVKRMFDGLAKQLGWSAPLAVALRSLTGDRHRTLWDMDHIVPVVEGGGECDLDNLRTLCIWCHKRVTAELAARRAEERRRQKRTRTRQVGMELTHD